jgi:hypothetical protein
MKVFSTGKFLALAALAAVVPAMGGITYTCDASIGTLGPANLCNTLNGAAGSFFAGGLNGIYNSTFTNASLGNVSIYIQYGSTGLAGSTQFIINSTYTQYADALAAHEGDANDATAVASLGGDVNNPVVAGDGVGLTSALANSLGLSADAVGITPGDLSCALGSAGCYNGIITMTNVTSNWFYRQGSQTAGTYDFFTAAQHETDEILGTISCIGNTNTAPPTVSCNNFSPGVSPADLFRYVGSSNVRSFIGPAGSQSSGSVACFSINGGTTDIACYNNTENGADYGDWDGLLNRVQNAFGTPGTNGVNITNDGGAEIALLDAVGYNLQSSAPEPATMGMIGASLVVLAVAGARRRRIRK